MNRLTKFASAVKGTLSGINSGGGEHIAGSAA